MATTKQELEMLGIGMDVDKPDKGAYIQNMFIRESSWLTRPGFGQLCQYDTTLAMGDSVKNNQGYSKHLGSHSLITDFGHIQTVSVFRLYANTASDSAGMWGNRYSVSVYDHTDDTRWEEVLYEHTSANSDVVNPMLNWRGNYQSSSDVDYAKFIRADSGEFFFTEFIDTLFFGSTRAGMWAYTPAIFVSNKPKTVSLVDRNDWSKPYGETSMITRLSPTDGIFSDKFAYLGNATYPNSPTDMTNHAGRLVIAQGRELYFSDIGQPASIIGGNFITIPSEEDIVAVDSINSRLLIFTSKETFVYQPNIGTKINKGRITKLSDHIGALSPSAVSRGEGVLYWVDRNGVYATTGAMDIKILSKNIDPVFRSSVSNPLTTYYANNGYSNYSVEQPRISMRLGESAVNTAYDPIDKTLLISIHQYGVILCYRLGSWFVWNIESGITDTASLVGATTNIKDAWVDTVYDKVLIIGSPDTYVMNDSTVEGFAVGRNYATQSYYILELGLGGSLDRNVDISADNREFTGSYLDNGVTANGIVYLDKSIVIPGSYLMPSGTPVSDVYLVPVYIVPDHVMGTTSHINLEFDYDTTNWAPVMLSATELEVIFPPQRVRSEAGYSIGAPIAGVSQMTAIAGKVVINWDGPTGNGGIAGAVWPHSPYMNINLNAKNLLFYIAFTKVNPSTTSASSMGIINVTAGTDDGTGVIPAKVYYWSPAYAHDKHDADDVAQPVDWVFKSEQIGMGGSEQLKARGVYAVMKSSGTADAVEQIYSGSIFGLYNTLSAPDFKGWAAQSIDYAGAIDDVRNHGSVRTRLQDNSNIMQLVKFNGSLLWGTIANTTAGNYLVGDLAINTIATSVSIRGGHFSHMLFGHIRNRAEKIQLKSAKTTVQAVGGRRRRGRG